MIYASKERSTYVISAITQSFIIIALNYVRAAYVASGRLHIIHAHQRRKNKNENIPDMCTIIEFQLDSSHRTSSSRNVERTSICGHAFGQFAWILLLNDGKKKISNRFAVDVLLLFHCDVMLML